MKHKHLTFMLAVLMSMAACVASAHDFEVDGIYYNITSSSSPYMVEVTFRGDSFTSYSYRYTGSVIIPESVMYYSKIYSVTSIGQYAFYGCSDLTSVTIGNGVANIGQAAFLGCRSLTSVTIPNCVTSIGGFAFANCSGLTSITIPNSVTSIGESAFSGCSSLTSIDIPNSVTSIGSSAFSGCSSLTSVTIPNNVTPIGQFAFYNCSKIKSVVIPDGVTTIPASAFYGCSRLSNVTIGSGVETIGNSAFNGCLITKIDCRADFPPTCGTDVFTMVKANCKLRVPEESVDLYRVHEAWSDFDIAVLPKPVTSISLNYSEYNLTGIGASVQLTATVLPTDADDKTVTWTSSDENVCTVNNGQVVATGTGTATVTATTTDGGLTATCAITVTQPVTGISLNYSEYALSGIGKSVLLVATVTPETATNKSVTWHSYNEAVCIVSNGMVISVGLGTAVVTATTVDGNHMAFCVVTVGEDVNTQITLSDEYSTFCSTKALDFTGVEGLRAYIASAYDTERGVLTLTRVYNVKARTGLILRGTKGETYEIPEGTGATTVANMLVGVVVDTELNPTDGRFTNFILAKDDIEGIGFYKVAHTSTLKAGKAYLQLPTDDLGSEVKGFRMMFDEDMSDGVEIVQIQNSNIKIQNEAGAVYDLQGRRVAKPTKGIYIVNGKKTVVK